MFDMDQQSLQLHERGDSASASAREQYSTLKALQKSYYTSRNRERGLLKKLNWLQIAERGTLEMQLSLQKEVAISFCIL